MKTHPEAEAFKLKMRSLTLPVLQILDNHLDVIEKQLEAAKTKTPNLFLDAAMILDMEMIAAMNLRVNLPELCVLLRKYGILPVGVQMIKKEGDILTDEARKAGMAIFNPMKHESTVSSSSVSTAISTSTSSMDLSSGGSKSARTSASTSVSAERVAHSVESVAQPVKTQVVSGPSMVITKPIRSGQQVYAEGGDLVVISSVSHGAELLADGNIHVYGALRGRALAGIQGNKEARIFCQSLEADLLSIAGRYMVSEVIQRHQKKGMQQIYLENDKLQIAAL